MKLIDILSFALLLTSVSAGKWQRYSHEYYAAVGCKLAVDEYAQYCKKPEKSKKYTCICSKETAIASWAICAYQFGYEESKINDQIASICGQKGKTNFTSDDVTSYYNEYVSTAVDVSDSSYNATKPKYAIYGDLVQEYAELGYTSYRNRWGNVSASHYLGIAFVAFTGFVMLVIGASNWISRFSRGYANSFVGKLPNAIRKNYVLGLVGNHLHNNIFKGVNPDRVEAVCIFLMFLYSILSCCIIGYTYKEGDPTFANYQAGTSRYWGDRSCILASYQLPLLFIFPGRNNFFQYITRWKYSRFVQFHKWLGRIIFMELLIHSFAMASQTYALSKFTRFHTAWYREGITATVCGGFILILAAPQIRKFYYELFLCTHVILVVMFLWTAWRHAYSQAYQNFYWACCGVWIFDTFIRFCRIVLNGGPRTAEIELFPGEEVLKINVPEGKILKNAPGSHSFIHFLTPLRFWQSHPFTAYPSETHPGYITYTCRVKKGMTKYIADKCKANGDNKTTMKICIDGYYGEQSPYQLYDKAVFITGGTGISGPYYHAKKLIENDPNREVKLYWGVRSYDCVKTFVQELSTFRNSQVKPVIYISKPDMQSTTSSSSDDNEKKEGSGEEESLSNDVVKALDFVEFVHGRLSATEIVNQEISSASGSVAIGACAHTQVVDEVRRAVANGLGLSSHKVEYFEEMQNW